MAPRVTRPQRTPAGAALTAQQRFPSLAPGLARFAASIKVSAKPPPSKRGIGALESGLEKFAAGMKFQ